MSSLFLPTPELIDCFIPQEVLFGRHIVERRYLDTPRTPHSKSGHHTLENDWSYTCPLCSCQHLNSSTASFRKKCCLDGTLLNDDIWTPLEPLIPSLEEMLSTEEGIRHMSSSCTSYNNILSIGELPDEYILLLYGA
jgi:hypothetical protein